MAEAEVPAGEGPSNWLSKIIAEKRASIDRLLPGRELRAQRDAIVAAIKAHPKCQPLADKSNLPDVIWRALELANDEEQKQKINPVPDASPAIKASWFVFDELELPHPDPEF